MESPISKPIGSDVQDLDTPSLTVDLDVFEENISQLTKFFSTQKLDLITRSDTHYTPSLTSLQQKDQSPNSLIAVSTLEQAEVFANSGFNNLLIMNFFIDTNKINKLAQLSLLTKIFITIDNEKHLEAINQVIQTSNFKIPVLVRVRTNNSFFGCPPGKQLTNLIKKIIQTKTIHFSGIIDYSDKTQYSHTTEKTEYTFSKAEPAPTSNINTLTSVFKKLNEQKINCEMLIVDDNYKYDLISDNYVTHYITGIDLIGDKSFLNLQSPVQLLSTVTSCPETNQFILDAGLKSTGIQSGVITDATNTALIPSSYSAEHLIFRKPDDFSDNTAIGKKFYIQPQNIPEIFNRHNYVYGIRKNKLESIYTITARGKYK